MFRFWSIAEWKTRRLYSRVRRKRISRKDRVAAINALGKLERKACDELAFVFNEDPDRDIAQTTNNYQVAAMLAWNRAWGYGPRNLGCLVRPLAPAANNLRAQSIACFVRSGHASREDRRFAIQVLGHIGGRTAVDCLVGVLNESPHDREFNGNYQVMALFALDNLGGPSIEEGLKCLSSPVPRIRGQAALSLAKLGQPQLMPRLVNLLLDDGQSVRSTVSDEALPLFGAAIVPFLIPIVEEMDGQPINVHGKSGRMRANWETVLAVIWVLEKIQFAQVTHPIVTMLVDLLKKTGPIAGHELAPLIDRIYQRAREPVPFGSRWY